MAGGAYRRFLKSEGRDATLYEVATSGEDSWGDPTSSTATTTSTKAIVRLRASENVVRTAAGEKVEIDAEIIVPDDLSVDPEANDSRPELEVGGERFKIWVVDDNAVDGGRRLLATRK